MTPARLRRAREILEASPALDQVLDLYAVRAGPYEVVFAAKAHPADGQSVGGLAEVLDSLDQQLRRELLEIGEVFIDVTANRRPVEPDRS